MIRIALIAALGPEIRLLREKLQSPNKYIVREYLSLDEVNRGLSQMLPHETVETRFDIFLMRVSYFVVEHVRMLERVRRRFPQIGLVTVAGEIDPSARYQVRSVRAHKLICERTEVSDLMKIIEKLKQKDLSALRLHPRSRRYGEAEIFDPMTGQRLRAKFVDVAQMGARVIVQTKSRISRHSRLELRYQSSQEPGKVHRIESMVVWEGMTGGMVESIVQGPQQIMGLRFIAAL